MPGGDRTGPLGQGPRTGRAAGYCAGYGMPGYANPIWGRGFGRGRGWGFGPGRGRGWWRFFRWGSFSPKEDMESSDKGKVSNTEWSPSSLYDLINNLAKKVEALENKIEKLNRPQ